MHVPPLNISEPCVSRGQGEEALAVATLPLVFNVPSRVLVVRSFCVVSAVVRPQTNRAPAVFASAWVQVNHVRVPAVLVLFLIEAANAALVLICSTRATAKMLAVTVRAIGAIRRYRGLKRLIVTRSEERRAGKECRSRWS